MKTRSLITAIGLLTLLRLTASAQTPVETAHQKGVDAVKLEDQGNFDTALQLLKEAESLDPNNIVYPYETTYCYYSQKNYQKVIDILTKLKDRPDSFDRLYELLGNSYDDLGKSDTALAVYAEGLKKFPKSGVLYLEEGVIPLYKKDYDRAISCFEKGIEVQPAFPSNYYWAARLYCNSGEKLWGLIYGELFINLERNSRRTQDISKLLFDTYKTSITFGAGGKTMVSLSKNNIVAGTAKNVKLPYSLIYEPSIAFATVGQTRISPNSLDSIRTNFLKFYKEKFMKEYPNALLSYQDEIYQSGNFEAYNHWLLSEGDTNAFSAWKTANQEKWDKFFTWFTANPIKLDDTNRFYRTQYQ